VLAAPPNGHAGLADRLTKRGRAADAPGAADPDDGTMTFASAFTTAASVLGIAGLAILVGAAIVAALADLAATDLVPARVVERTGQEVRS